MKGKKDREITDDDEERKKRMRKPVDERLRPNKRQEGERQKEVEDWTRLDAFKTKTHTNRSVPSVGGANVSPPPMAASQWAPLQTLILHRLDQHSASWKLLRADFKSFKEPSDLKKKLRKKKIERAVRATSSF